MSKLDLEITSKALSDIEQVTEFIARDNKLAALKMAKLFYDVFEKLAVHPRLGKIKEEWTYLNILFYTVKHRYIVAYRVINNSTIRILRVLSSYQDICSKF